MTSPRRRAVPHTVTDVPLWLLAADVAAAHIPHPDQRGRCANLRCTGEAYPCPPARDAQRAYRAASRPRVVAQGRARVTVPSGGAASGFAGWFRPTRPAAPPQRSMTAPHAA
jgi:hypothetical protein